MNLRSFILLLYTRVCPIICTRAGERKKNKRTLFRADYPSWIRGKAVSRGRASPRLRFPPRLPERKAASSALPGTRPFPRKLPGTGRVRKTGAGKAAGRRQAVACQGREHTQRLLFRPIRRFFPLSTKGMITVIQNNNLPRVALPVLFRRFSGRQGGAALFSRRRGYRRERSRRRVSALNSAIAIFFRWEGGRAG